MTPVLELIRPLGEGGMGKVWVARHKGLETDVVVKFLAAMEGADQDEAEARFAREASAAAAVKSPHVVQVFDHGRTSTGLRYIVMELLEGRDLAAHLAASGPMKPSDVAALVAQVAKALSKAHQAGIVHRDIKPENIFVCDGESGELFVKVLDFGIAKREQQATSHTTTGHVVGTPAYMSPEQIFGEAPVDARTDIWALGVVAFEALTGRRPFDGRTIGALALAIHRSAPRPSEVVSSLPPEVDAWFARACARDPNQRFPTAREAGQSILMAAGAGSTSASFRAPTMSFVDTKELREGEALRADSKSTNVSTSSMTMERSPPHRAGLVAAGVVGLVVGGVLLWLAVPPSGRAAGTPAQASAPSAPVTAGELARKQSPPPLPIVPESSASAPASSTTPSAPPTAAKAAVRAPTAPKRPVRKNNDDDIK